MQLKRGDSPTLALMKKYGAPLTREEYLRWSGMGKGYKPSAEEEAEMPEEFRQEPEPTPQVTDPEKKVPPPPKKATSPDWVSLVRNVTNRQKLSSGAPADFAGTVIPNPNGIKPRLDTEMSPVSYVGAKSPDDALPMASPIPTVVTTPRTHQKPMDVSNGKTILKPSPLREQ